MQLKLEKPWTELTEAELARAPGHMGVYQLADASGNVVYIGYAGGRALFGLRSELQRHLRDGTPGAEQYRYEVNTQYLSRWRELVMLHRRDTGNVPPLNEQEGSIPPGRLS